MKEQVRKYTKKQQPEEEASELMTVHEVATHLHVEHK